LAQVFDNTQTGEAMTKRMIGGILLVSMVFLASGCATIGGAAVSTVTAIPDCANAIVANEDTSAGQKFFDIISHHTYNSNPDGVVAEFTKGRVTCYVVVCITQREPILKIFADNGFDTEPVWLDEFGWETKHADQSTEETQGKYLVEALEKLRSVPRIEAAFIYHITDDPRFPEGDYGVLRADSTPKRAYYYLKDASP